MAERGWDTAFWNDTFVQGLSSESKLLFVYLATSPHCNQAGLYEITLKTIAFDTGLAEIEIPQYLKSLEPKVAWYPEYNIVWVKNFVKRQTKSPKFLIAVAKCLNSIHIPALVQEFIQFNLERHSISIPYEYTTTTIPIPPSADLICSNASASSLSDKEERGLGGEREKQEVDPEDLAEIATLYEQNIGKITEVIANELNLAVTEYPAEWIKEAIKIAVKGNHRNWRYIEGILKNKRDPRRGDKADDPNKYVKGKYGHMVQR